MNETPPFSIMEESSTIKVMPKLAYRVTLFLHLPHLSPIIPYLSRSPFCRPNRSSSFGNAPISARPPLIKIFISFLFLLFRFELSGSYASSKRSARREKRKTHESESRAAAVRFAESQHHHQRGPHRRRDLLVHPWYSAARLFVLSVFSPVLPSSSLYSFDDNDGDLISRSPSFFRANFKWVDYIAMSAASCWNDRLLVVVTLCRCG